MTDHLSLYYTKMTPLTPAKASLVIVHGFGEHSHRFSHIAYFFCLQSYEVHMIDLAGFGYSGGMRFISSIKMFHQNIHKLL
jgi:acylglycerol lipase